jgi:choline/glycine/proline betaine transport protein
VQGVLAAALLIAGGLAALQSATIASAFPFAVIMVLMAWGLLRSLRIDVAKHSALAAPRMTDSHMSWRDRLRALVHQPSKQEVLDYIKQTVLPALNEVADELKKQGLDARVETGEDGRAWIEVRHGDQIDFFYSARPHAYEPPALVMRDTDEKLMEQRKFYRIEVHLGEGGQDYDIMGWTKETILNDVLEQYSRHVQFLGQVS